MKQWKFRSRNSKSIRFRDFSTDFRRDSTRNAQININSHKLSKDDKANDEKLKLNSIDIQVTKDLEEKTLTSWGAGKEGSLGTSSLDDSRQACAIHSLSKKLIIQVVCGAGNSLVLTSENTLFSWGFNSVGQLGLGHTRNTSSPCLITFDFKAVKKIVSGAGHCMVINTQGELFSWGCAGYYQTGHQVLTHNNLPRKVSFFETFFINDASCGISHSLVLTGETLFTFGDNSHGQCSGLQTFYQRPIEVPIKSIIQIAAGGAHSLVLLNDGKVLTCGLNSSGQLGLGHCESCHEFSEVKVKNCVKVFAGEENSAGLTSDGRVFIWGNNGFGQLGQGHFADLLFPCQMKLPEKVKSVSLGVSAVAVISESDSLYCTGYVGTCLKKEVKEQNLIIDKMLATPKHFLNQAKVTIVALGRTHCLAFIEKIIVLEHNESFEWFDLPLKDFSMKNRPLSGLEAENEVFKPFFPQRKNDVFNDSVEKNNYLEVSLDKKSLRLQDSGEYLEKTPHQRDKSLDSAFNFSRNQESALVTLLSFQKAKEEGREMVKNFRLFDDHFKLPPSNLKPLSEDKLMSLDKKSSKKLQKMKSLEKEKLNTQEYLRESTGTNFFPNIGQTFNMQQQRLKELEYLAGHYDRKLSRYSKPLSPKIKNAKVSRRVGGGYVG
jgi:alpha-tubulin suppressor-like RCC1 family protein